MLTSSHVVAPWRWPKYYPEEWLRSVNEKHTYYTVEIRHPDGMFLTTIELAPVSYHHAKRDVAILKFENEDDAINILAECNYFPYELNTKHTLSSNTVSLSCISI